MKKQETRIVPEEVPPKFYAEHLKPYEFLSAKAAGKKILEIGCGDGYGAYYLAQAAQEVTGIDYENEVILRAQDKYKSSNLKFITMEATDLRFEDGAFDIICSFQVIEHIPEENLPRYLSEIRRALKDNGSFYLSTLNLAHNMKSPVTYKKNQAHCKEFRLPELKGLLSSFFSGIEIYGLQLSRQHNFYQFLKKAGILNFLPAGINPVGRFYNNITTGDFRITAGNLGKAIDFICICKK